MEKKKFFFIAAGVLVLAGILFFAFGDNKASAFELVENYPGEIIINKGGSCGCCDIYENYFKDRGNSKVRAIDIEDVSSIKKQYGIPPEMESCHTTIIGDYFVEGHMPLEAIEKLLNEKPDIKGIALPGMPMGSPGMTGQKSGDFVVYAVNNDGTSYEFMRV